MLLLVLLQDKVLSWDFPELIVRYRDAVFGLLLANYDCDIAVDAPI